MSMIDKSEIEVLPRQLRAARAFLGLTQGVVAAEAGIAPGTLKRLEAENVPHAFRTGSIDALLKTYARHGIRFTGPVFEIHSIK